MKYGTVQFFNASVFDERRFIDLRCFRHVGIVDSGQCLVAPIEGERGTNQILVSEIAYLHGDGSLHVGKYMIADFFGCFT